MKNMPRILPLAGLAVVGVLAVNFLAGAKSVPELFTGARAFAEERAGAKPSAEEKAAADKAASSSATRTTFRTMAAALMSASSGRPVSRQAKAEPHTAPRYDDSAGPCGLA